MLYEVITPFDFVFDNMGHNVSRITSFGNNTDFFLSIGQIIRKINSAVAVPHQMVYILRCFHKTGFIHHRHGAFSESDHHVHLGLF